MTWSTSLAPVCAEADTNHALSTHATQRRSRNAIGQHSVYVRAPTDLDRKEHSGIRTTGANRINERSLGKHDGFPCAEVSRCNRQRNRQFLKGLFLQGAGKYPEHTV